jgi:hypothetical protein
MLLDHMMATVREQGYWRGMLLDRKMATVREQGYWRGMVLDHTMATVREQGYWRGMLLDHMMATVREQGYWRGMLLDHTHAHTGINQVKAKPDAFGCEDARVWGGGGERHTCSWTSTSLVLSSIVFTRSANALACSVAT